MQSWAVTDAGCVRPQNQDAFHMEQLQENCALCTVCDGMGGAKSGNVASCLAVEVFAQEIRATWRAGMSPEEQENMLRNAVKLVNFAVYDQAAQFADFAGMGTTLVAALVDGKTASVVNVGDSRAYHISADGITKVTQDHSIVQMMVDRGELTAEEAKTYPGKNLITRAIGTDATVECDLFRVELERGDCILLCSDGLTNLLDEQEILFEVAYGEQRDSCCQRLLDIALNRGAPDNVTCLLLQV
jgi:protein phosphatase